MGMANDTSMSAEERRGTIAGILCYVLWGSFPLYWKLLVEVDPFEIAAHRMIWCFVFVGVACAILGKSFLPLLHERRALQHLVPAALIITINWTTYIIAVNTGYILESSLGYYINPLVSILLGRIVFGERLSRLQTLATVLCTVGVVWFTIDYGRFPVYSIALALTFGIYGAIKKHGGYPAIPAIVVENTVMVPVALFMLLVAFQSSGSLSFLGDTSSVHGWSLTGLLVLGGAVTAIPLILFAIAANKIRLSYLGFIQYVSPTISLLIGVFVFGEAFTSAHAVCFGCIWAGLALVLWDTLMHVKHE